MAESPPARYRFNDREYGSLDDMPPEVRALFEKSPLSTEGGAAATPDRPPVYIVNNKTYERLEDVPPEIRALIETHGRQTPITMTSTHAVYRIGDREYHSLDEMPPELRALFEDRNRNGVPDVVEKALESPGGRAEVRVYTDMDKIPAGLRDSLRPGKPSSPASSDRPGITIHITPGAAIVIALAIAGLLVALAWAVR
jgi:hypothetical protein